MGGKSRIRILKYKQLGTDLDKNLAGEKVNCGVRSPLCVALHFFLGWQKSKSAEAFFLHELNNAMALFSCKKLKTADAFFLGKSKRVLGHFFLQKPTSGEAKKMNCGVKSPLCIFFSWVGKKLS